MDLPRFFFFRGCSAFSAALTAAAPPLLPSPLPPYRRCLMRCLCLRPVPSHARGVLAASAVEEDFRHRDGQGLTHMH